jgi:hypothetical protein
LTAVLNLTMQARAARSVRDAVRGYDVLLMVTEGEKVEALQLVGDSGVVVMTAREIRPQWRHIMKTGDIATTVAPQAADRRVVDAAALLAAIKRR